MNRGFFGEGNNIPQWEYPPGSQLPSAGLPKGIFLVYTPMEFPYHLLQRNCDPGDKQLLSKSLVSPENSILPFDIYLKDITIPAAIIEKRKRQ